MEEIEKRTAKGLGGFYWRILLLALVGVGAGMGCWMSRQISGPPRNAQCFETRSTVESLTESILSTFQTKDQIIQAFQNKGFSINEKSNGTILAYKKANSGKMHFSVLIGESADGFYCIEIKAMGIGL